MDNAKQNDVSYPKEGPSGIGGWLILHAIALVVQPFMSLKFIVNTYKYIGSAHFLKVAQHFKSYYAFSWFTIIACVVLITFLIYVAIQFFNKKKNTPKLYVALILSFTCFALTKFIWTMVEGSPFGFRLMQVTGLLPSIGSCAIWIPYFIVSKRVKNTFVN